MDKAPLDRIHIRDLHVRCIIGVFPEERRDKQDAYFNVTLYADLSKACATDDIKDTVDYKAVKKAILALAEKSSYNLLEHLAEKAAEVALQHEGVARVDISVDKPGALRFARSVAVEISRFRGQ